MGVFTSCQEGMKRTLCMQGKKFPIKFLCLTSPLITSLWDMVYQELKKKYFLHVRILFIYFLFFLPVTFLAVLTLRFLCPNGSKGTFQSAGHMNLLFYQKTQVFYKDMQDQSTKRYCCCQSTLEITVTLMLHNFKNITLFCVYLEGESNAFVFSVLRWV